MSNNTIVKIGPSFATILALLFIGLKLTGQIGWSWWWVLSPLWVPPLFTFGIVALFALAGFLVIVAVELSEANRGRRRSGI